MPKPVMATAQDVKDMEARLTSEVGRVEGKIDPAIAASEARMKATITGLDGKVTSGLKEATDGIENARQDTRKYTDDSCKALHEQLQPDFQEIASNIVQLEERFTAKLTGVDNDLKILMGDELQLLTTKFDEIVMALKSELTNNMEIWAKEAAQALVDQRHDLETAIADLRQKAEDDDRREREQAEKALSDAVEAQDRKDEKQDERSNRAQGEIYVKISQIDEKLDAQIALLKQDTGEAHETHVANYDGFVTKTENKLGIIDDDINSLRNSMSEVENVSTRRVDWVIKNVSKRIRPLSPSRTMLHTSWFSPKFDAAGAYGMQLELQLFRASDPPVDGEDAGDVAIHLWACKGMSLAYKLSCGGKSTILEKTFNGRVPYGTKRFCFLKDQINREDDTLKVSVEILEAVREVEHIIKPPPLPIEDPEAPPKSLEEVALEQQIQEKALKGSMYFHRLVNNRLYDQVKAQVHVLQSRMVRKIEWRIDNASMLRRCFPANECMCSASFSAAGIEAMQFIFYPSGYKNATDNFCSLFLFGPAGATIKCTLSAGNQRRDASHSFDEPGAFGRTNFARFDSVVDEDNDCIMVTLDIEDAQQDLVSNVKHPIVQPGDRRTLQQIEGTADKAVESIVKLTKKPGARASGKDKDLIELKVLPSLWTAKQLGTITERNDGMRNFDDLKIKAKGAATKKSSVAFSMDSSTMPSGGTMQASSSLPTMPTIRDNMGARAAMEEDLALPNLQSTEREFLKKAESRRRPRPNLGSSLTAMQ